MGRLKRALSTLVTVSLCLMILMVVLGMLSAAQEGLPLSTILPGMAPAVVMPAALLYWWLRWRKPTYRALSERIGRDEGDAGDAGGEGGRGGARHLRAGIGAAGRQKGGAAEHGSVQPVAETVEPQSTGRTNGPQSGATDSPP